MRQIGSYRKSQLTGGEAHEQKTLYETVPGISCLAFNRKLQGTLKGQKIQFEETEQASEPDLDLAGMLEL